MSLKRQPTRFSQNAGILLNVSEMLLQKCHLYLILWQNYSQVPEQSLQSSGSLRNIWTRAKSNPFSTTPISISMRTLELRLKTVLTKKTHQSALLNHQSCPI